MGTFLILYTSKNINKLLGGFMRKLNLLILGVLLISTIVGCNDSIVQNPSTVESDVEDEQTMETDEKEAVKFKLLENVFGFPDESGKIIITIPNENGNKIEGPEEFNIAIGNNGEVIEIEFFKWQDANDKDDGRQTMYNFNNMAGYIYKTKDGSLNKNKSYLLTKNTTISKSLLAKLKSTKDIESENDSYKKVDIETIKKIEAIKNRSIVENSLISETTENEKICLFVFEREADDMLASIAYIKGDKVVFKDYPAKYNETSTWRADAGDHPGLFEILFLAKSDEGLLLGVSWTAPEGENVFVLKEVNGAFQETDLKSSRYCAP
jgi:hypothetical protein